jgi:hypothetical protein
MIRHRQEKETRRKRIGRRIGDWVWDYNHGYWFFQRWEWFGERFAPAHDQNTLPDDEIDTPEFDHEPDWYTHNNPEEGNGRSEEI